MLGHEIIREFAEEIIMNHDHEGMEAVLYEDGEYWFRPSGSMSPYEDEIMVKIPLGQAYWRDSYVWEKDLDEELVESAIDELVEDIFFRIDGWEIEKEGR